MKPIWDRIKDALILAVNAKVGVTFTIYEADALLTIMQAYDELEAENELLKRWIPVSERLPEEGQSVIVYDRIASGCEVVTYGSGEWKYWEFHHSVKFFKDIFTHWMPLPQPPEGE